MEATAIAFNPNPIVIEPGATTIEGKSGAVYRRCETLSFQRYGRMADFQLEMLYDRDPMGMMKTLKTIYGHLNSRDKLADAAVLTYNTMKAVEGIMERKADPMIKLCMLFWNKEGENNGEITDDDIEAKCRDVDHIDARFFFEQAASCIADFSTALKPGSPTTSAEKPKQTAPSPASPSAST